MHPLRAKLLVPVAVLALTLGAITAVWLLVGRASSSREAQLQVASMKLALSNLQSAPFNADPRSGGSASAIRVVIQADEQLLSRGLTARSQTGVSAELLAEGRASMRVIEPAVEAIYRTAVGRGGLAGAGSKVPQLQARLVTRSAALTDVLDEISKQDAARAASAREKTTLGATAAMLLLMLAFAFVYFRSVAAREAVERLADEKQALLGESRVEARTDALTDLGNRRALGSDLARATARPPGSQEVLLAMFDLDGFKQYNDTFGHAAGDALLRRVGARLTDAVANVGAAYRMGGDEFCLLARCHPDAAERLLDDAVRSLQTSGEGWQIGCS